MYAAKGGGGVNTNAYKCVQGGRGGLNMTKNTHFVRRLIENGIISEIFKDRVMDRVMEGIIMFKDRQGVSVCARMHSHTFSNPVY